MAGPRKVSDLLAGAPAAHSFSPKAKAQPDLNSSAIFSGPSAQRATLPNQFQMRPNP